MVYSTYLGGSSSDGTIYGFGSPAGVANADPGPGIAVDSAGEAVIAGYTASSDFPTTSGAFQPKFQGGNGHTTYRPSDGFVTKLNAAGEGLVYSTFLGGATDREACTAVTVDANGNATVTGGTKSTDFLTRNPVQSSNAGGMDAYVTTLNASGSALLFSTYLGGTGNDLGCGVALDTSGNIYMVGFTQSLIGFASKIGSPYSPTGPAVEVAEVSRKSAVKVPILPPSAPGSAPPAVAATTLHKPASAAAP